MVYMSTTCVLFCMIDHLTLSWMFSKKRGEVNINVGMILALSRRDLCWFFRTC